MRLSPKDSCKIKILDILFLVAYTVSVRAVVKALVEGL